MHPLSVCQVQILETMCAAKSAPSEYISIDGAQLRVI